MATGGATQQALSVLLICQLLARATPRQGRFTAINSGRAGRVGHTFSGKLIFHSRASSPQAPRLLPGVGVLSRAAGSVFRRHEAGWPRYAQANAPQRRGANVGPMGITRERSIERLENRALLDP